MIQKVGSLWGFLTQFYILERGLKNKDTPHRVNRINVSSFIDLKLTFQAIFKIFSFLNFSSLWVTFNLRHLLPVWNFRSGSNFFFFSSPVFIPGRSCYVHGSHKVRSRWANCESISDGVFAAAAEESTGITFIAPNRPEGTPLSAGVTLPSEAAYGIYWTPSIHSKSKQWWRQGTSTTRSISVRHARRAGHFATFRKAPV